MNYLSRQFAEEQAESDLRAFCQLREGRRLSLPIDPGDIAETLWQTDVIFLEEGTLTGEAIAFADLESNKIIVEICGFEPRDRFSVAHEVGHVSMHRYLVEMGERKEQYEKFHEYQADAYASALLMPKLEVLKVLEKASGLLDDDSYRVRLVSDQFHVSQPSARIRLQRMNLITNPNMRRIVNAYDREVQANRDGWFAQQ